MRKEMKIAKSCKIHKSAIVYGQVELGEHVNVWCNAVIRGDVSTITIGDNTNIQDLCMLHNCWDMPMHIGQGVTVGHGAILHSCTVGENTLIGMGAIVLDGAKIGKDCIIGAGTLIPPGKEVPDGMLAVGNPFKILRPTTDQEKGANRKNIVDYLEFTKQMPE